MKKALIKLAHLFFQSWQVESELKNFAQQIHYKNILEIGSGNNPSERFFDKTNKFIMSDNEPKITNCMKIDVCKMRDKNKYDLIICINVLDDIFRYQKAVDNIFRALKNNGQIFLVVNGFYPLHDLPNDYWRFTDASLRKIFSKFKEVNIKKLGIKYFPSYYILIAKK